VTAAAKPARRVTGKLKSCGVHCDRRSGECRRRRSRSRWNRVRHAQPLEGRGRGGRSGPWSGVQHGPSKGAERASAGGGARCGVAIAGAPDTATSSHGGTWRFRGAQRSRRRLHPRRPAPSDWQVRAQLVQLSRAWMARSSVEHRVVRVVISHLVPAEPVGAAERSPAGDDHRLRVAPSSGPDFCANAPPIPPRLHGPVDRP
jgi:hypothetical protein